MAQKEELTPAQKKKAIKALIVTALVIFFIVMAIINAISYVYWGIDTNWNSPYTKFAQENRIMLLINFLPFFIIMTWNFVLKVKKDKLHNDKN